MADAILNAGLKPSGAARRNRVLFIVGVPVFMLVVGAAWSWTHSRATRKESIVLASAVFVGDMKGARTALEHGADPNARVDVSVEHSVTFRRLWTELQGEPSTAYTLLMSAAHQNRGDIVRLLLKHGANPNVIDNRTTKRTALHVAVSAGALDSVRALLEQGADVNATDRYGSTPLCQAAYGHIFGGDLNSESEIIRLLLAHGAKVNHHSKEGSTPLFFAAMAHSPTAMTALLDAGAEVDARNQYGNTPLHMIVRSEPLFWKPTPQEKANHLATVRVLLDHGADPAQKDNAGVTPIASSRVLMRDREVIAMLQKAAKRR